MRRALRLVVVVLSAAILGVTDRWFLGENGLLAGLVAPVAGWLGMEHSVLSSNGSNVIATGIVLFWNFFANRMWTFSDVDDVSATGSPDLVAE